ncbi:MAG: DUF1801 domain-containing protein [Gammaproteobacteria bacterium]
MAELKTRPSKKSVRDFLLTIEDLQRRQDCGVVAALMRRATGKRATLWGDNIVGFGRYDYQYANGEPASWFLTGFSPRKRDLSIYIMPGFSDYEKLLSRLGKHKTGKSCLYIKRLSDIDKRVLGELIDRSVRDMLEKYG